MLPLHCEDGRTTDTNITVQGEPSTLHAAEQLTAGLKKPHDATTGPASSHPSGVSVWAERPRTNGRLLEVAARVDARFLAS